MRRHTKWSVILVSSLLLTLCITMSAQEKRPMTFVDTIDLKRVSGPQLSLDGKQILFTITEANWEKNKTISHIWRVNTDGKGLVQMLFNVPSRATQVTAPRVQKGNAALAHRR